MSDELKAREIARRKIQAARDRGEGSRGVSHYRENPYSSLREPELHSAWESGWRYADEALRGASGGGADSKTEAAIHSAMVRSSEIVEVLPTPAAATVGAVDLYDILDRLVFAQPEANWREAPHQFGPVGAAVKALVDHAELAGERSIIADELGGKYPWDKDTTR